MANQYTSSKRAQDLNRPATGIIPRITGTATAGAGTTVDLSGLTANLGTDAPDISTAKFSFWNQDATNPIYIKIAGNDVLSVPPGAVIQEFLDPRMTETLSVEGTGSENYVITVLIPNRNQVQP